MEKIITVNSVKKFLAETEAILESLTGWQHVEVVKVPMGFHPWLYYSIHPSEGRIIFNLRISWYANLDFKNCAETSLETLFCHLAHGDDCCGGAEYASLEKSAKEAHANILRNFKSSFLQSWHTQENNDYSDYSSFEINRKRISLYFNLKTTMRDDVMLHIPEFLKEKEKILTVTGNCVSKGRSTGKSLGYDDSPELFAKCRELISAEFGIEDVALYCYIP